jgi:hypothetical protein
VLRWLVQKALSKNKDIIALKSTAWKNPKQRELKDY